MRNASRAFALAAAALIAQPIATSKHEQWFEARSPNFVVVCNAGEKRTFQTAKLFEQIRSVFRQSIPIVSKLPSPIITVIAVKNEDSMRTLLPEDWTKGHVHHTGYFFYRMDQYYATVELDSEGTNPYSTIYHEYYHSLTLPYFPSLPLWVAEGLAEFYGNTQIEGNQAGVGYAYPELIDQLKTERFIPLDVLFKVDHNSPYYNENNKTSMFYAESWALVHYLMVGDKAAHRPMFSEYLKAFASGATQDEASAKAFGNLQKLESTLLSYMHNSAFYFMNTPVNAQVQDSDIKVREISEAEADAYEGGFLAARGRTAEARPLLEEAVREDPKLALGYQNLGVAEFMDHHTEEALTDVSKAIVLDPKSGLPRYLRAYLAFRSGTAITENAQLEDDLRVAIAASPDFAPAYSLLALRLAATSEDTPEALQMAKKAVSLQPGNGTYLLTLAQVLARMRKFDEAQVVALRASTNAQTPGEKQQAESFLSYLQEYSNAEREASSMTSLGNEEGSSGTPAQESNDESSEAVEATGTVTKGSCDMGGPKLELKTETGTVVLHAPVNGGIQILMRKAAAGFNPCTSLTGAKVSVKYVPNSGTNSAGTLKQIEILELAGGSDEN